MKTKSEQMIVSAPMSYTGSTQRLVRIGAGTPPAVRWGLIAPMVGVFLLIVWTAVTVWYLMFGLLLVPYRLMRRGSRKRKIADQRHREMLQALNSR